MEEHMFDVARLVEKPEALGEAFDLVSRKSEAMIRRFPGNSFVFVEFKEGGGVLEIAAFALWRGRQFVWCVCEGGFRDSHRSG